MRSTNCHSFIRSLKRKGLKEEIVIKIGLHDLVTSTTLESNKSHLPNVFRKLWSVCSLRPVLSRKGSVLRRDFASAKLRESLSRLSVAARGITVHSSRQHAAQLGTVCRQLFHVETAQNRVAVGSHRCSLVNC